mmetsp:Transcript_96160/g.267137  ORF Transcript_96160/g.267137 Transcript_96160/m.267137 type:complete len:495 (+) Transcript_96160:91-1575(+)
MPLLETTPTAESACVSTAPTFEQEEGRADGARKAPDPGWWAFMEHNGERDPSAHSSWATSALWCLWFVAFSSTALIPAREHWWLFNAAVMALVLVTIWIPDYGDTVFPYYSVVILPIVVFKSVAVGGVWCFGILGYAFAVVPFWDCFVGVDVGNHTQSMQKELHGAFRFEFLTLLVAPGILACLGYGAWLANFGGLSLFEGIGLGISVGVITGVVGIVAGHELCHRASWYERALGRLLLCCATYGHFYIEHTLGHHKWVGTDRDPATARYGESFYAFLPRVVKGELCSAMRIERDRLRRKGLPSWHSEVPAYFLVSVSIVLTLACLTGPMAFPFFALQSVAAIILFQSVNYVEHYGLERREVSPGQYEVVQPKHSWDAPTRITNHIMFRLQRHADHHAHAGKRYQTLQAYDSAPQMPSGYATMLLLAFVPPLWRSVMHPRLLQHRRQQIGQRFRYGPSPGLEAAEPPAKATAEEDLASASDERTASLRLRSAGA